MKIFALETDEEKLIKDVLSPSEVVLARVKFSAFLFVLHSIKALFWTLLTVAVGYGLSFAELPLLFSIVPLLVVWLILVFRPWFRVFIDWKFDLVLVTNEEIVIVDQTSIFRSYKQQVNLENVTGVVARSQFANIFPFGRLDVELKDDKIHPVKLGYIPHADRIASIISNAIVAYQRREAGVP